MTTRTRSAAHWFFLVGAALSFTASCSPADPAAPSVDDAASATDVAPAASRLGADVSKSLASLRSATAAFHDVNAAIAAGYASPSGIPCVESPEGTMGVHVVKASLLDQAVRPNEPELLLYLPKANGGFKLVGVEYLVPVLVRNLTTGAVSPWFEMTPWGASYAVVTPRPSVFGEAFEGPMPGHEPGMPWHYDKHVWLWNTNPSGMFSQWNPSIACP
ncbi:hypothetical protein [Gemmatimonas groenlandica]|uniref:Uncharacterized protein n=1 Tax=Gemmatimonas groenlandica TaxID=2732249 RepID=A0A6M4IL06_9BACT|nr:hypothetical protein [Gemmatimonas groenlandica]QJR35714.1 hypothetical protein HKW67_09415 [Gemmatimonas groenlandica]